MTHHIEKLAKILLTLSFRVLIKPFCVQNAGKIDKIFRACFVLHNIIALTV